MRIAGRLRGALAVVGLACGLLVALPSFADTLRGALRKVDAQARRIVVQDLDGDDNHFQVARTARIVLNGNPAELADLRPGDRVAVVFSEDPEGKATATVVEATRAKAPTR